MKPTKPTKPRGPASDPRGPRPPGRRREPERPRAAHHPRPPIAAPERPPASELAARLRRLDGKPFAAYRTLVGTYPLDAFEIVVDDVAVAAATGAARIRLRATTTVAGIPTHWTTDAAARLAVEDLVARSAARAVMDSGLRREGAPPGSGGVAVEAPGEAIVERGACRIAGATIELRLLVDLPAQGRAVRGLQAEKLLCEELVRLATSVLLFGPTRRGEAEAHVAAVRRHRAIQEVLPGRGLVTFFCDGAAPSLPESLSVVLDVEGRELRGAGIPAGVTLIAGESLSGASPLLEAIASGVHPHPPAHPRSGIVTIASAARVGCDPDRQLDHADLSLFVRALPSGPDPASVTCRIAPPALTQAAAAVEAIAAGAKLLLVDENDSAASFLARDARMQRLIPAADAAVIPLVDRAGDLYDDLGVSTIVSSSAIGDFLGVAHTTLVFREGVVEDATFRGRKIAEATRAARSIEARPPAERPDPIVVTMPVPPGRNVTRIALHGREGVRVGDAIVDLGASAARLEPGVRRALGAILVRAARIVPAPLSLSGILDAIEAEIETRGLEAVAPHGAADLVRPRRVEIAAAVCRSASVAPRSPER